MNYKYLIVLVMTALGACEQSDAAPTQLLVEVSAEDGVADRLQRVAAYVVPADATTHGEPQIQDFSLVKGGRGVQVELPFSFVVAKGEAETVLLVIEGFESDGGASIVVEHKLITSFRAGVTRRVNVELSAGCLGNVCSAREQTCSAETKGCIDVESGKPISMSMDAGTDEMDAAVITPDASEPEPERDSGMREPVVTKPDAGPKPSDTSQSTNGVSVDDRDSGPEPSSVCDDPTLCRAPYPCVENDTGGYTCQGQLADWPMPDPSPGAKTAPSYDYTSVPGVVLDNVTKLEWQRMTPATYPGCSGNEMTQGDTCTWAEAKNYCSQLDLAGGGWRLPSKIELESLIGDTRLVPSVDFDAFPNLSGAEGFWSLSPTQGKAEGLAWAVYIGMGLTNPFDPVETFDVRCVRAGALGTATPRERYQANSAANSLTDTRTKLEWQRDYADVDTLEAAREHCSSQDGDWRLPGLNELLTLIDPQRDEPATSSLFPRIPIGGMFWSNVPMGAALAGDNPQTMIVDFAVGMSSGDVFVRGAEDTVRFTFHARCVR